MHLQEVDLEIVAEALISGVAQIRSEALALVNKAKHARASADLIEQARDFYAISSDNNIEIDDDAGTSQTDNGTWVQAWVWLQNTNEKDDIDDASSHA